MTPTPAAGADHTTGLADIAFARRIQTVCAWCGPAFIVLLFGGWGLLGGFVPLISGGHSAGHVAAAWADHHDLSLIGLSLGLIGCFLTFPFSLALSLQMRRTERRFPILAVLQLGSGLLITLVLAIPMLIFIVGAFRPDRSAELTQTFNDLSSIMLILPWPPIIIQIVSIALAILHDDRPDPVFPRWAAYFNLWVGALVLPANLIIFFKTGPFAWTGIVGFWVPAAVFGGWYIVMFVLLQRAIRSEAEEERTLLVGGAAAGSGT